MLPTIIATASRLTLTSLPSSVTDGRVHDPRRVDDDTQERIVKDSGLWVAEVAKIKVTPALR
jgi:hypothetical protein